MKALSTASAEMRAGGAVESADAIEEIELKIQIKTGHKEDSIYIRRGFRGIDGYAYHQKEFDGIGFRVIASEGMPNLDFQLEPPRLRCNVNQSVGDPEGFTDRLMNRNVRSEAGIMLSHVRESIRSMKCKDYAQGLQGPGRLVYLGDEENEIDPRVVDTESNWTGKYVCLSVRCFFWIYVSCSALIFLCTSPLGVLIITFDANCKVCQVIAGVALRSFN
jgi:hypothetical protein